MLGQLSFTNILTTLTAISASVYGFMVEFLHCAPGATDFAAKCDLPSFVPVNLVGYITVGFGVLAFLMKIIRPGGAGASLWGPVAVVVPDTSPKSVEGTATPQHVMAP